ncbi:transglycosylase SLT domain-containing protein [Pseudohalocynthiibacter aestuariivivens]|jgi:soluble lytic murein transglycosylase-like protein|uniref:Transglycosylase SLT domain-containing protein n=1 Tax=Pseudohalocynthiibacter aestuariivivens TaxID=1591409 RepID=A0ABV5JDS9_9RHOB|nr:MULTISPECIES: lytic transglycosylase domain-containing protein [Pseudohalocynthiibacter]MBS9718001.1 lytic transglycosylase domain-containing protein [Pseudohalocynthiibacter aestuariivivens]MCK0103173.1 lytic transglycosylase domain-containing protein [Pseudohalocynthiibacter sp. F2068]
MQNFPRRTVLALILGGLAACGSSQPSDVGVASRSATPLYPNETPELRALIEKYAAIYDVPVDLVHRVVIRESTHNPAARNGPYYGLMQILPQTARGIGYEGTDEGLMDAETNLRWGVKYLRGAWLLSDGDYDTAVSWYARGYYYEAKRRGMLEETGLR